jgi:hypothetical protein
MSIETSANAMFRRTTDVFIQQKLKKLRSIVGADRIARTAHPALAILGNLRAELGMPISLAWIPLIIPLMAPMRYIRAATLIAYGLRSTGYKKRDQAEARRQVIAALRTKLMIGEIKVPG